MPATRTPLDLCLELARAYATLVRRLDGQLGSFHGLSFGDFAILVQLGKAPERRLRRVDLADRLGLTPSAVTRALIPLEKIGLVKREAGDHDARVGYASLTKAGERLLEEARETGESVAARALPLDPAGLAALSGVLGRLL